MLGSCSNDDVAVTNGTPGVGNGNGLVPVELALNGPSVTVEKRETIPYLPTSWLPPSDHSHNKQGIVHAIQREPPVCLFP